jgi:hypothetical protein
MTRDECIAQFNKMGFSESEIVNLVVQILGAKTGTELEMKGLSMKAFITPSLDIVFNGGKRHSKLEEAIKSYVAM